MAFLATGIVIGAAFTFVTLRYHVVRANDGMHLIPRVSAEFQDPYVDIRGFGVADWNERRELVLAIVRANKGEMLGPAAADDMRKAMEGILRSLQPPK